MPLLLRTKLFPILLVTILFVSSCKSAMERADDAYLNNVGLAQEYATQYPALQEYLETGCGQAEELYEEAQGLDEEARTAKLELANEAFGATFHALRRYHYLEGSIKRDLERLDRTRTESFHTGSDKRALWEDADRILEESYRTIRGLKPENPGQSAAEISRQVERLEILSGRLGKVLERARRESEARRKKRKKKSQGERKQ